MNHHRAALDAAKEFLEYVRSSEKPTLRGLAMRLDTLATLMWPLRDEVYDPDEIPDRDAVSGLHDWCKIIHARFPDLGREVIFETSRLIDIDLAELCMDLEQAIVVQDLSDDIQAAEHMSWMFWIHSGHHLRSLQLGLHDVMACHNLWYADEAESEN